MIRLPHRNWYAHVEVLEGCREASLENRDPEIVNAKPFGLLGDYAGPAFPIPVSNIRLASDWSMIGGSDVDSPGSCSLAGNMEGNKRNLNLPASQSSH